MPTTLETLHVQLAQYYRPWDRNPRSRVAAFCAMLEDFVKSKKGETHQLENLRLLCTAVLSLSAAPTMHRVLRPGSGDVDGMLTPLQNASAQGDVEIHHADYVWDHCPQCAETSEGLEPIGIDECPWDGVGEAPDPESV